MLNSYQKFVVRASIQNSSSVTTQRKPSMSETLLAKYHEMYREKNETNSISERTRLTTELMDLDRDVRAALKREPVSEPVGVEVLNRIADQMVSAGYGIFAPRLRDQHKRHPISVPFRDMDHVRTFLLTVMEESVLNSIAELAPKKHPLLSRLFGNRK